ELREDEPRLLAAVEVGTNTAPQPREVLRSQFVDHRGEAVMPAVGTGEAQAQRPERERNIVDDRDEAVLWNFIELHRVPHRPAREVHVGRRLDEQELFAPAKSLRGIIIALARAPAGGAFQRTFHTIDDRKTDVMPRPFVLAADIAKPGEQPHTLGPDVGQSLFLLRSRALFLFLLTLRLDLLGFRDDRLGRR